MPRIVRGAEVTALRQDADGVELTVDGGTVRADYAVGADGVHSAVREALGLPFPGKSVLTSIMLADVRLAHAPAGRARRQRGRRRLRVRRARSATGGTASSPGTAATRCPTPRR